MVIFPVEVAEGTCTYIIRPALILTTLLLVDIFPLLPATKYNPSPPKALFWATVAEIFVQVCVCPLISWVADTASAPQADWVAIKRETSVDAKRMRERENRCFMVADMFEQQVGLPTAASDFKVA